MCIYQKAYVVFADVEQYSTVYTEFITDNRFILIIPISVRQTSTAFHESVCSGCIICGFSFNYTEILLLLCQEFWCSGDLNASVGHIKNKALINMSNGDIFAFKKRLDPNCFELLFNFQMVIFLHTQKNRIKICIIWMNLKYYFCNVTFLMQQNLWIMHIMSQTHQNKNPLTLWQRKK